MTPKERKIARQAGTERAKEVGRYTGRKKGTTKVTLAQIEKLKRSHDVAADGTITNLGYTDSQGRYHSERSDKEIAFILGVSVRTITRMKKTGA